MNKLELTELVAVSLNTTKVEAAKAVEAVICGIKNGLKKDKKVVLTGFGTFDLKVRPERQGVHPKTQQVITIPSAKVIRFKEGKEMKESL